jgi:predicted RNase H-like HicB family nuclease
MNSQISGDFKNSGNAITFNLTVIAFQEDNIFFVYTPALDLTGYGNTEEEARLSFEETLDQFLNYSTNKDTLVDELKRLGWKVSKKSVSKPPSLVDMINSNDYLAEIFEEKQYKKFHKNISLPSLV